MSCDDKEIIAEFVVESREHLAGIENQLLAIESGGADIDIELVNEVFRAVHSIKGAAGFLGFSRLGALSHELENVLNLVRNEELIPDSSVTDVMLKASDRLRGMINDIESSNEVDVSDHVALLQGIVAGLLSDEPASGGQAAKPDTKANATEEMVPESKDTAASQETSEPTGPPSSSAVEAPKEPPTAAVETASPKPQAASGEPKSSPSGSTSSSATTPDASIRVAVSVVDQLMNLAGELVLSRNQLLQTIQAGDSNSLDSASARVDQVTSELQETIMQARMQAVGSVLNKFPRIVRDLSNSLGKECELIVEGKEVELDKSIIEAIGDPLTHLIRNAVDHGVELPEVRKAAGKPPQGTIVLRAFHQAGKVNISIRDDGAGIDAARLREKAISRSLITPEQAQELSDREAIRLIFHPGFSLAEKVTDVSGRGVGMDVVKTNIEKLGGAVGIESQLGTGTTINVALPLTLAIIPSLIVHSGGSRFAVPQTNISELVRVKGSELTVKIQKVNRAEVLRLRGELLPLVHLDRVLDLNTTNAGNGRSPGDHAPNPAPAMEADSAAESSRDIPETTDSETTHALSIIVVETGHLRYGLAVAGLHDSEEIVVKPLGRHMQDSPCLSGATILGDGQVAMILDVAGIAVHSNLKLPDESERSSQADSTSRVTSEKQTLLLFSNAPGEQFAIPMVLIARLERFRTDQIDNVGGQDVLEYRGTSLPLLSLENLIRATPRPETEKVYVVVFKVADREVGLIIPELVDIREVSTDVDVVTLRETGVIGSVVVDGKTTRILDMSELAEAANPRWFEPIESHTPEGEEPATVLVVEDSAFFRAQLARFLEELGIQTVECEDGLDAWNVLQHRGDEFGLVLTDLDMPVMDGFQLARKIKDSPEMNHLPVIAVTALASEDDVQRGRESGIDEYLIKLDREQLKAAVARHLRAMTFDTALA